MSLPGLIDIRLRSKISKEEMDSKVGKILRDDDYNVLLTGPTYVRKPDGSPLVVYLPQSLPEELLAESYAVLHSFKNAYTDNRGLASGTQRLRHVSGKGRTRTKRVPSAIIGSFDPGGPKQYCRLTAFSQHEGEKYASLFPLFTAIGQLFQDNVPDRFATQMEWVRDTHPDWVISGTPFTTITVNNTWATGVHTDKGDLDEGFSTLACLRYGDYEGGILCFPEYRVAVDMQHGDVVLMDAHQWHGNTPLELYSEDAERISVVSYFRSGMKHCDSLPAEQQKAAALHEKRIVLPTDDDATPAAEPVMTAGV